ncbi:hypothetical protein N7465_006792 [Penicillium sp. CMV-2018d]|nr:hypothetical protein N7465_006792 [Penicillium sp. CMV-2018d]
MYRFQSPVAVASVPLEPQAGVRKAGRIHAQNHELYQESESFGLLAFSTLQNLSLKDEPLAPAFHITSDEFQP